MRSNSPSRWDELIVYVRAAWEHVVKQIKITSLSVAAMLQGFDQA